MQNPTVVTKQMFPKQCSLRLNNIFMYIIRPITDALEIPHLNERFSIVNHVALVGVAKKFLLQVS